jgi:hypothetical protein
MGDILSTGIAAIGFTWVKIIFSKKLFCGQKKLN